MGEILDGAFTAIRWNPKTILTSSAVVTTISAVVGGLVSYVLQRQALNSVHVSGSGTSVTALSGALDGLTILVGFFANAILTGMLTVTIGQGVVGQKETLASAWRAVRPRLWRLIAMLLLFILFLVGGWSLALLLSVFVGVLLSLGTHLPAVGIAVGVLCGLMAEVFAVIVLIRWSLAVPVVMLERVGPLKSLGRSWRLVRRSSWRVFGILLTTLLIVSIAALMITLPFTLGSGGATFFEPATRTSVLGLFLRAIGQIVGDTLTAPLFAGVVVLLYTDLRMRREGVDITLRAAAAGGAGDASSDGQNASPW
jgi:Membrane domain of glycerophosphoryl diester phosphodiesterase